MSRGHQVDLLVEAPGAPPVRPRALAAGNQGLNVTDADLERVLGSIRPGRSTQRHPGSAHRETPTRHSPLHRPASPIHRGSQAAIFYSLVSPYTRSPLPPILPDLNRLLAALRSGARRKRRPVKREHVIAGIQVLLNPLSHPPAVVFNGRLDIVATNDLGRARYAPVFQR